MNEYHLSDDNVAQLSQDSVSLLKTLISIPSYSKEENHTADAIEGFLIEKGIVPNRYLNNVWATNLYFDISKKTLLLNSHHDTVKPAVTYTHNPFDPLEFDSKLYGLGSNDAGGCLVSLLAAFRYFFDKDLPFNVVFAATAEEEISGANGIEAWMAEIGSGLNIDCAIVGEPTLMKMAVAEKGLLVLNCTAYGVTGHAARDEGDNALYKAMKDIEWFSTYQFPKVSDRLGPVHMAVTSIETPNKSHNVVPDICKYVVDIRCNELYNYQELLSIIQTHILSVAEPRSTRLKPSFIPIHHPLVEAGTRLGLENYGSPTCSDMTLLTIPAVKIGPGDSARSHMADEFIYLAEIPQGIELYIKMIGGYAAAIFKEID